MKFAKAKTIFLQNSVALYWLLGLTLLIGGVWYVGNVWDGRYIAPQSFQIGPVTVYAYGLTLALATYVAMQWALQRLASVTKYPLFVLGFSAGMGLLGARLYHVISEITEYKNISELFKIWEGGLSIIGFLIGIFLSLSFMSVLPNYFGILKRKSIFFHLSDALIWPILLGQIIGRWANFWNYEILAPAQWPAKQLFHTVVPLALRPFGYESESVFSPWYAYESLGLSLIFIVITLYFLYLKRITASQLSNNSKILHNKVSEPLLRQIITLNFSQPGLLTALYLMCYGWLRFILEPGRIDQHIVAVFGHFVTLHAGVGLMAACIGSLSIMYLHTRTRH